MDNITPDNIPVVKDAAASNSKELLNAYIYDFLLKSGFNDSALAFFKEANIPMLKNNIKFNDKSLILANNLLPKTNLTMETQHGFIYEWWQVFWDIFNARTERDSTINAAQYYHTVSSKRYDNYYNDRPPYNTNQVMLPPNRYQRVIPNQKTLDSPNMSRIHPQMVYDRRSGPPPRNGVVHYGSPVARGSLNGIPPQGPIQGPQGPIQGPQGPL